jgi:ricin-type beta-trefoil lectin protein
MGVKRIVSALGLALVILAVNAAPVGAVEVWYIVRTYGASAKCIDVVDGATGNGARIQQWTCSGVSQQRWNYYDVGGGYVRIVNQKSRRCLDVLNGSTGNGTAFQQWDCNGSQQQQFTINSNRQIRPRHASGSCADVNGPLTAEGARIQLWTCLLGPVPNQTFTKTL